MLMKYRENVKKILDELRENVGVIPEKLWEISE